MIRENYGIQAFFFLLTVEYHILYVISCHFCVANAAVISIKLKNLIYLALIFTFKMQERDRKLNVD